MALTTFTAGQVLTAAQLSAVQANDYNQTVSNKTASYTLVAADKGTRVVMNVASANTVTVNTSLFSAGDTLVIQNIGAGVTTVTAGTATVSSAGPLAIPQNGSGLLYFTSAGVSIFYPSAVTTSSSGLTLISSTTFSSVATVTVSSAFSATYKNYKVLINNWTCASGTPTASIKLGSTTTNYVFSVGISSPTAFLDFANGSGTGTNIQLVYLHSTNATQMSMEVLAPNLAQKTFVFSESTNYQNTGFMAAQGSQTDATSFTAFTLLNDGPVNMSGTIEVYGYAI